MSDFICINDRNQLPKYIPGYDTPEKAEAASLAMSANQVVVVTSTDAFGGPGSFIKSLTLVPNNLTPYCIATLGDQTATLWETGSLYNTIPPPVAIQLGITINSGTVGFSTLSGITAIVTGYFTPTV